MGLPLLEQIRKHHDCLSKTLVTYVLFEALIANSVLVCVPLMRFYIGTAQLKTLLGWASNRTSKEAPDSTC